MVKELAEPVERPVETTPYTALYLAQFEISNYVLAPYLLSRGVRTGTGKNVTAERMFQTAGIDTRFTCQPLGEKPKDLKHTVPKMAISAAKGILQAKNGWVPDTIIFCSSYPFEVSVSESIAQELDAKNCQTHDVYAYCAGGTIALQEATDSAKYGEKILVVGAEHYSAKMDDDLNRSIFSDGAAAFAFEYGKDFEVIWQDNAQEYNAEIRMPVDFSKVPPNSIVLPIHNKTKSFWMDGPKVLKWVSRYTPFQQIVKAWESVKDTANKVHILFHQGSGRMTSDLIKKLRLHGVDANIFEGRVSQNGNLAAVSILSELHHFLQTQHVASGDVLILSAFGAGGNSCTLALRANRDIN